MISRHLFKISAPSFVFIWIGAKKKLCGLFAGKMLKILFIEKPPLLYL